MALPQQRIQVTLPEDARALRLFIEQRLAEIQRSLSLFFTGKGTPYNIVDAPRGSLYLRTDGGTSTTLYINETGGKTGWVAK